MPDTAAAADRLSHPPDPAPRGHLFVVHGDMTELVADAFVIPTDINFSVRESWHGLLDATTRRKVYERHRPEDWHGRRWGRSRESRNVWFIDVGDGHERYLPRLEELLEEAVTMLGQTAPETGKRPVPLLALPVLGIGGGGEGARQGAVLGRLVTLCRDVVDRRRVDLVLVTPNAQVHGALQHLRRADPDLFFPSAALTADERQAAKEIADKAQDGSLALFIGAGASMPAGLPSWGRLLEELVKKVGLEPAVVAAFGKLDDLDKAELLQAQFAAANRQADAEGELGQHVHQLLAHYQRPAISHCLLAALRCPQAVTTNYDNLYENAAKNARIGDGGLVVALPGEIPGPGQRWLLKMHGTIEKPKTIVLTRQDFVDFNAASGPSGAVFQSLLLTKHVLVVGSSLNDDNVLRLVYEVGRYRRQHAAEAVLGTVLAVEDDPARQLLYRGTFNWRVFEGAGQDEKARRLEVFLDCVVAHAVSDRAWLLDPRFGDLVQEDPERQKLVADLREVARRLPADPTWEPVRKLMTDLGAYAGDGSAKRSTSAT